MSEVEPIDWFLEAGRAHTKCMILTEEIERLREALQSIVDHYPHPDISHVDFRVTAYQAALSVLDAPFTSHKSTGTPNAD